MKEIFVQVKILLFHTSIAFNKSAITIWFIIYKLSFKNTISIPFFYNFSCNPISFFFQFIKLPSRCNFISCQKSWFHYESCNPQFKIYRLSLLNYIIKINWSTLCPRFEWRRLLINLRRRSQHLFKLVFQ